MRKKGFLLFLIAVLTVVFCSCEGPSEDGYMNSSNNSEYSNLDITNNSNTSEEDLEQDNQDTYLVDFDTDGGEAVESMSISFLSSYVLPTPKKDGYEFGGWYNNGTRIPIDGIWFNKENITLKAKWSFIGYNITYDLNGGSVNDASKLPSKYEPNDSIIRLDIPYKSGNVKFMGWQVVGTETIIYDIPKNYTGSISLKACFYEYEYTYKTDEGLLLYLKDDNTLSVVGYEGELNNIVIPKDYNGCVINEINKYAFACFAVRLDEYDSYGFLACLIPETVTKIGEGAFARCENLKVQYLQNNSAVDLEEWINNLEIETRNEHVYDVIMGKRPAIGWKIYYKP